ncbi:MAG: ThiF family adenylyltransferase [Muribaculaceae bacterium]
MTGIEKGIYNRNELLLGEEFVDFIAQKRIIIFGVGGVGSWCAESLVRSGIRQLTIVDSDRVCITNVNRQNMATTKTVGKVKVEALKERLLEINPQAQITALQMIYNKDSASQFNIEQYDCVIDAIDSLQEKAHLIRHATSVATSELLFLSSMGAALRIDPTKIRMAEFWDIKGDPLARALRNKFKRTKDYPRRKFKCVFSEEQPLQNAGKAHTCGTAACMCPKAKLLSGTWGSADAKYDAPGDPRLVNHEWCTSKAQINGSLNHITGIFGMMLAGSVIQHFRSVFAKNYD